MPEVETTQNGVAAPPAPEPAVENPPGASPAGVQPSAADSGAAQKPPKAKDWAAAARAQHDARQARREREAAAQRAQAESQKREAAEKRAADLEKELEAIKARAKSDALALAAEQGGNVEDNIRGYVDKTTPERKIEALERKLAENEAKEQKRQEDWRKAEEQRQQQAYEQAQVAACRSFVQAVRADKDKARYLNAELDDEELFAAAVEFQKWAAANGKSYPFEAVRDEFDKRAKLLHDRRTQRRNELLSPPEGGSPASATEKANGQLPGNGHRDSKQRPESRTGNTKASARNGRQLTRDEEEAEDLAALRVAFAKDATAKRT